MRKLVACPLLWGAGAALCPPLVLALAILGLGGCGKRDNSSTTSSEGASMKVHLTSAAFQEGQTIPRQYTADGKDISPPLQWDEPPQGTQSWALICDDPDAPRGTWVHWVLFNLPAETRSLEEGMPASATLANAAKQGKNDFRKLGYGGPAPPPGKPHRYFFKLYAVDQQLDLAAGATKAELVAALKGHVLAEGQLMGRYGR
jgi:Raf kinase inhibitor-like YbhB/YbcL family protein